MTGSGVLDLGSSGVLAPGRLLALRANVWIVVLAVVVVALANFQAIVIAVSHHRYGSPVAGETLGLLLACGAYALLVRVGERRWPKELALRFAPTEVLLGWVVGLGMMTAIFAVLVLCGLYEVAPGHPIRGAVEVLSNSLTGAFEELIFRAIVFRLLARALGLTRALLLSACLFGALHLFNPHATVFGAAAIAFEAGLMLASFYLLTGRIWVSIGVHAGWNFAEGPLFGAHVSGFVRPETLLVSTPRAGLPDVLTGGTFGPEASIVAMFAGLLAFAIVMSVDHKTPAKPSLAEGAFPAN